MYNVCVYVMYVFKCKWCMCVCTHAHATAYMEIREQRQLSILTFTFSRQGLLLLLHHVGQASCELLGVLLPPISQPFWQEHWDY